MASTRETTDSPGRRSVVPFPRPTILLLLALASALVPPLRIPLCGCAFVYGADVTRANPEARADAVVEDDPLRHALPVEHRLDIGCRLARDFSHAELASHDEEVTVLIFRRLPHV